MTAVGGTGQQAETLSLNTYKDSRLAGKARTPSDPTLPPLPDTLLTPPPLVAV